MVKAIVFDFDGTIADTESAVFQAWSEVYRRRGAALTRDEWSACIGRRGGFDAYGVLANRAPGSIAPKEDLEQELSELIAERVSSLSMRPGVADWIRDANELGIGLGIASSSPTAWVDRHLRRLGVRDNFAVLTCCDGRFPSKPDPGSYLRACAALGADAAEAIAVEDSPNGVAAAVAAGLFCIAVPNNMTLGLPLDAADILVQSLRHVTVAEALAKAATARA